MAYAPGDPNTPSSQRTRANGWIGSRYVGTGQQPPPIAPPSTPFDPNGHTNNTTPTSTVNYPVPQTIDVTAPGFDPSHPGAEVEAIGLQNAANNRAFDNNQHANNTDPQPPSVTTQWNGPAYQGTAANSNAQGFRTTNGQIDPLGTTHKYIGGQYLQAHPGDIAGMLRIPQFQGWTQISGDKIRSPEGSIYDVRNSNGSVQWQYISGGPAGTRNDGIPGNDPHGGHSSVSANDPRLHDGIRGNAGQPITGAPTQGTDDALLQELIARSHQSLDVNSANSPAIRSQMRPYQAAVERQQRDYLADIAERSGPVTNMRGETRLASEHAGQAIGSQEALLVGQEILARRQEIQDALTQRGALMTEAQRQALTRELAQLSDATQRLGIQTNAGLTRRGQDIGHDEFTSDLGLRAEDRFNYWDAINRGLI